MNLFNKKNISRRSVIENTLKFGCLSCLPPTLFISNLAAKQPIITIRDTEIEDFLYENCRSLFHEAGLNINNTKFILIANPDIGAFATNGQNVFLHTGLFTNQPYYYQTKAVIAHELSHIIFGHPSIIKDTVNQLTKQMALLSVLSLPLIAVPSGGAVAAAGGILTATDYFYRSLSTFTRNLEEQADEQAAKLLLAIDEDPRAMSSALETLMEKSVQSFASQSYYSTHPVTKTRINNLKIKETELSGPILFSNKIQLRYERIQGKISGYFNDPVSSIRVIPNPDSIKELITASLANMRLYKFDKAREYLAQSLVVLNKYNIEKDAYYYELAGDIEIRAKNYQSAYNNYYKAVDMAKTSPLFVYGLITAYNELKHQDRSKVKEIEDIALRALNIDENLISLLDQLAIFYNIENKVPERELYLAEKDFRLGRHNYAKNRIMPNMEYYKTKGNLFIKARDILVSAPNN